MLKEGDVVEVDGETSGWLRLTAHWEGAAGWVLVDGTAVGLGPLLKPFDVAAARRRPTAVGAPATAPPVSMTPTEPCGTVAPSVAAPAKPPAPPAAPCDADILLAELAASVGLPREQTEALLQAERLEQGPKPPSTSRAEAVEALARAAKLPVGMRLRLVLAARKSHV